MTIRTPTSHITDAARLIARFTRRLIVFLGIDRLFAWAAAGDRASKFTEKFLPTIESYSRGSWRRLSRDGITIDLDPSDYTHWLAYFGIEDELKSRLYALAQPGDTVIDVGTNVGEVLLHLSKAVSPGGRAIGFEANPTTHALAASNLQLNPKLPAEVHALGLGDEDAELDFGSRSASNSGADTIMAAGTGTRKVKVVRLDDFVASEELSRVDVIKIDVEGFELQVLRGAERTIERFSPALFIELCDANLREHGTTAKQLVEWLEAKGYSLSDARSDRPVLSSDDFSSCFLDVISRRS